MCMLKWKKCPSNLIDSHWSTFTEKSVDKYLNAYQRSPLYYLRLKRSAVETPDGTLDTDQLVDGDTNTCLHLPARCSSFAKVKRMDLRQLLIAFLLVLNHVKINSYEINKDMSSHFSIIVIVLFYLEHIGIYFFIDVICWLVLNQHNHWRHYESDEVPTRYKETFCFLW